jgi:hypothetical protein
MQPAAAHVEVSDEFIVRKGEGGGGAGSDPDARSGLRYVSVVESPGRRAEPGATLGVSMLTSISEFNTGELRSFGISVYLAYTSERHQPLLRVIS